MRLLPLVIVLAAACDGPRPEPTSLSPADRRAIEALHEEFTQGWLANDSGRVLETLSADAVLLPHWGDSPVVGARAIQAFWWPPDASPTRVEHFSMHPEEIGGAGELAFARGRYALTFLYMGRVFSTAGNYLMVFRRGPQGWRITHRMWNDPPPR